MGIWHKSMADVVSTWHVPPRNQGQIVEIAYGTDEDGIGYRRTTDRSDNCVTYESCNDCVREDWDPANSEPTGYDWELCAPPKS